MKKLMEKK